MGRPYSEDSLFTYEEVMDLCDPIAVNPKDLIPTQDFAMIKRLVEINEGKEREGPDPYPHLVKFEGKLYVHNGHHAWLISLIKGEDEMLARVQAI